VEEKDEKYYLMSRVGIGFELKGNNKRAIMVDNGEDFRIILKRFIPDSKLHIGLLKDERGIKSLEFRMSKDYLKQLVWVINYYLNENERK
jgi:hypothetical protein